MRLFRFYTRGNFLNYRQLNDRNSKKLLFDNLFFEQKANSLHLGIVASVLQGYICMF